MVNAVPAPASGIQSSDEGTQTRGRNKGRVWATKEGTGLDRAREGTHKSKGTHMGVSETRTTKELREKQGILRARAERSVTSQTQGCR